MTVIDLTGESSPTGVTIDFTTGTPPSVIEVVGGGLPGPKGDKGATGPSFRVVQITVSSTLPAAAAVSAGTGKTFFRVNEALAGWHLTAVAARACVQSSSAGQVSIQITNAGLPILATPLTIDQGQPDSSTAAAPAVIDPTRNTLHAADSWSIDVLAAGTGTIGLILELRIDAP